MEARFVGLTESTDAFTVIADIIDGDFDDVEDNLTILANFYGFDVQKLIFEWSDFEDIIAKKDLDDVNSMSAWLSKHSEDYPLLKYLFQTFIVLPTSTSDMERGFSKMNAIKTALRNRLGSVLIHLLWISMYGPSFDWDYASLARYVASKIWKISTKKPEVTTTCPQ